MRDRMIQHRTPVQEFRILQAQSAIQLEKKVQQYLEQGWELQGGVGVAATSASCFVQSMVRCLGYRLIYVQEF